MNMTLLSSYCHDVILSVSCSIDDRDRRSVMADENSDQFLSRRDSFGGLLSCMGQ